MIVTTTHNMLLITTITIQIYFVKVINGKDGLPKAVFNIIIPKSVLEND